VENFEVVFTEPIKAAVFYIQSGIRILSIYFVEGNLKYKMPNKLTRL